MKAQASFLTISERASLVEQYKRSKDKKLANRINAILLLDKGYGVLEVSTILMLSGGTIRSWFARYCEGGLDLLLKDEHHGRARILSVHEEEKLDELLQEKIYSSTKEILALILAEFGKTFSTSGVNDLLKRMCYSYKKPIHVPGKADQEKQEAWIAQYEKLKATKAVEDQIYFMDGCHPMHNSKPSFGWIKKKQTTVLKSNTGRSRLNINGAYALSSHRLVYRTDHRINAQSTIELLGQIKIAQPIGRIYIVADNARYYKNSLISKYIAANQRVEIIFLPPYSSNLNIIERLWRFFKKKVTNNRYIEKFSEFEYECKQFFNNLENHKLELSTLMTDNFQKLPTT
jgi:transposase